MASRAILVVDDDRTLADTRVAILRGAGCLASAAYDGKNALRCVCQDPPDLLITDIVMPGMNGVELAIAVKELVPNCKILICSGEPTSFEELNAARRTGTMFEFAEKPLYPPELLEWALKLLKIESPAFLQAKRPPMREDLPDVPVARRRRRNVKG